MTILKLLEQIRDDRFKEPAKEMNQRELNQAYYLAFLCNWFKFGPGQLISQVELPAPVAPAE